MQNLMDDERLFVDEQGDSARIYGEVEPARSGALNLEEAELMRQRLEAIFYNTEDDERQFQLANQALFCGLYRECIPMFHSIAQRHPARRGDCEGNIGVAHFFLGEFETAIAYYALAAEHGANARMMHENITEARIALGLD